MNEPLYDLQSADYRAAAGDHLAFRYASNILDMALAAAEAATALDEDTENSLDAIVTAEAFYTDVTRNIVQEDSCGPVSHIYMGEHRPSGWKSKHKAYLLQAEICRDLLDEHGTVVRNENFAISLGRLKRKILDGFELDKVAA